MKKRSALLDELVIWFRGRFTLTSEEKFWILLILIICWVGLITKYIYLRRHQPEPLTPQQVEELMIKDN